MKDSHKSKKKRFDFLSKISFRRFFSEIKLVRKIKLSYIFFFLFFLNLIFITIFVYLFHLVQKESISKVQIKELARHLLPYSSKSPGELPVSARSIAVYEKDSRAFVIEKNSTLRFSPASSAKIMTSLVALEAFGTDKILNATNINIVEGSKMGLFEGEAISVENLLYGLLLPSGNDAAFVIANSYTGGQSEFISRMNTKARELKLLNTNFIDAAGFEDDNYTTANDLARLASAALENSEFRKIVSTKKKIVYDTSGKIPHDLKNLNELLDVPGVYGVKTGFTDEAGGVLVTAIDVNKKTYIVVVLKSDDRFADTNDIIREVVKNIQLISF
ncbi:MAG: hypothetical protein AUK12_00245 [Candidatus Levybacteria bacterium CG2_30_37_29]|nr:MAG: hypothetical protein AUK12_00245 [Candidatus Levybacteria bacterium CG2_30_37_29]